MVVVAGNAPSTTLGLGVFAFLIWGVFLVVLGCVEWDFLHNSMLNLC